MMHRRSCIRRFSRAASLSIILAAALGAAAGLPLLAIERASDQSGTAAPQQPAKKGPIEKFNEPWPDAAKMEERRAESDRLALFASAEPLVLTISADFEAINKIRQPDSPKRLPGVLELTGEGGKTVSFPVQLGSRGHLRLNPRTCSTVPLRVEFTKKDVTGSVFDGQDALKVVTHCQNDTEYEQNVLAEYLAYRIGNIITPLSYRVRLAKATYVDSVKRKSIGTRYAVFIEDDSDVARRNGGRIVPLPDQLFRRLDQDSLMVMSLLQFMLGNTDYSIIKLHNVRLVQTPDGPLRPVTYNFDLSGLVNARYAVPPRGFGIATVRDRYYRGPCLTVEQLEPWLAKFRSRQGEVMALVDDVPGFEPARRRDSREFLGDFFSIVNNGARVKRLLVDRCPRVAGM